MASFKVICSDPIPGDNWNPKVFLTWAELDEDCNLYLDSEDIPRWMWDYDPPSIDDWVHGEEEFTWALKNGFVPGQKILIRFWPPVYSRDYYGEWDAEYNAEVVGCDSVPIEHILNYWEGWLARGVK